MKIFILLEVNMVENKKKKKKYEPTLKRRSNRSLFDRNVCRWFLITWSRWWCSPSHEDFLVKIQSSSQPLSLATISLTRPLPGSNSSIPYQFSTGPVVYFLAFYSVAKKYFKFVTVTVRCHIDCICSTTPKTKQTKSPS